LSLIDTLSVGSVEVTKLDDRGISPEASPAARASPGESLRRSVDQHDRYVAQVRHAGRH